MGGYSSKIKIETRDANHNNIAFELISPKSGDNFYGFLGNSISDIKQRYVDFLNGIIAEYERRILKLREV